MKNKYIIAFKVVIHLACLVPVARLSFYFYSDYYFDTRHLGTNPIEFITHSTGDWTMIFLLITLSVTPLRRLSGLQWLGRLRRMIGLYAFFYACLHFTTYLWLDQEFNTASMIKDIAKRPFITAGFTSFVLMVPLALTSNKAALRLLTGKRWQQLHRLIYVSAIAGVVHYWWLVKADITQPAIYASILAALLAFRLLAKLWSRRWPRPAVES